MGRGKTHRRTARFRRTAWVRAVARLGVVLLLLNVVSPALAATLSSPSPAPSPADGINALLSGKLVICTPTGLRVIALDGSGLPADDPAEQARDTFCPFCPPLSGPGAPAAQAAVIALAPPAVHPAPRPRPSGEATPADQTTPLCHSARGPPAGV